RRHTRCYRDWSSDVCSSDLSGNTEETLSAFDQALATPAKKLAITAGGKLLASARGNGVPIFTYEFGGEPRAALGWGLMPLLAVRSEERRVGEWDSCAGLRSD